MSAMLDDAEIALARAELHVLEARGRLSDQLGKIDRLKARGEDALEAEQTLGLFEAYLSIMERHRDFLLRSQRRPSPATPTRWSITSRRPGLSKTITQRAFFRTDEVFGAKRKVHS
jgi:hypothetical protein